MSLIILLLMLSGIVQQTNGQDKCIKIKGDKQCCKTEKPIHCAFQPPSKVTDDCKCLPKTTDAYGTLVSVCNWSNSRFLSTNHGTSVPCTPKAADGACAMNDTRVNPPDTACHHYPPPASVFESIDSSYCEFMKTETEVLPDEDIYNVYFTCWLYDCGNRLEKTQKTLDRELKWCYPPVLPGNGVEFCDLYVHDDTTDIYKATPFAAVVATTDSNSSTPNVTEPNSMAKGCVLPPICKGEIVDKTKYMLPWNGGKADKSHCERLCPKVGPNNGKSSQEPDVAGSEENRCRMLPTCGNEEKYNRFQVSDYATNCRDWCQPNSTHYLAKIPAKDADCNAKPLCKVVDGAYVEGTDTPFSVKNPYGAEDCDTPTTCKEGQTEDTHHCTKNAAGDGNGGARQIEFVCESLFLVVSSRVVPSVTNAIPIPMKMGYKFNVVNIIRIGLIAFTMVRIIIFIVYKGGYSNEKEPEESFWVKAKTKAEEIATSTMSALEKKEAMEKLITERTTELVLIKKCWLKNYYNNKTLDTSYPGSYSSQRLETDYTVYTAIIQPSLWPTTILFGSYVALVVLFFMKKDIPPTLCLINVSSILLLLYAGISCFVFSWRCRKVLYMVLFEIVFFIEIALNCAIIVLEVLRCMKTDSGTKTVAPTVASTMAPATAPATAPAVPATATAMAPADANGSPATAPAAAPV